MVVRQVFPDALSYQVGTPANYGFAERNGRVLSDNAPEVMFSMALNSGSSTGLTTQVTAGARDTRFPHVVPA